MSGRRFAVYNAFSDSPFGGSAAGLVLDTAGLDAQRMQAIARELDLPATAFVAG